ncbi:MAG TPA: flagellar filament protein FlaA [Treponema sp.]|nr:flagellar filament protein FlaA [Treponema sp.]
MKKLIIATVLAAAACGLVFAQTSTLTEPNPENVGNDSAMQALREISIDKFEREGAWNVRMSPDYGIISGRLFDGSPSMKEPLQEDKDKQDADTQVLGVKVEFFKRGVNSFYIMSERPLPIEGVTKTVSVWVCGRNQSHELYLLVQDYFGNNFELYMGDLGFSGWKKLTAVVPPSSDGVHGIVQNSSYYGDRPGLRVIGFRVDCNPMLARGSYYMYMDDLRAVTDLYDMENHDEDDMTDNW